MRGAPGRGGSRGPPDDPPREVRVGHGYITGVGEVRLFYRAWEVPRPRAKVLLVHGLGEHSGRYGRVAAALTRAGFSAYAADHRGHGRSRGRRGHVQDFGHFLRDLDRLRRRVCASDDGGGPSPAFVTGVSLGGLVTLRYLQEFSSPALLGGVVVAPFVRVAVEVPGWKLKLGALADRFAPGLVLDNEMDGEALLRDPEEREDYGSDPLVHSSISARLWGEMLRQADVLVERAPELTHPVLVQVPEEDRVVDAGAVTELGARLGGETRVLRYPEAYHDLYHDPVGERALADAVGWLEERAGVQRPAAPRAGRGRSGSGSPGAGAGDGEDVHRE